jgi:ribA/ribD-fused uncharacterized protein
MEQTNYDPSNYTFFWQTESPFSNWHPAKYTCNEINFNCSEQGVMYDKALLFGDIEVAKNVLKCSVSEQGKMKSLGRKVNHFKENTWKKYRVEIYTKHCKAKFTQNEHLKQKLIETRNTTLVEASPNDKIWGIGLHERDAKKTHPSKWPGTNLLGQLLTKIRDDVN